MEIRTATNGNNLCSILLAFISFLISESHLNGANLKTCPIEISLIKVDSEFSVSMFSILVTRSRYDLEQDGYFTIKTEYSNDILNGNISFMQLMAVWFERCVQEQTFSK